MTVSYSEAVATSKGIPSCFVRLLRKWRGSIYKLIYGDLLVFLGIFYSINLTYRFLLTPDQKEGFHEVVHYFNKYSTEIPITFVLGFYVSIVVGRWIQQVWNMPWPDPTAVFVSSQIRGNDENGRKMRRTVMRYICLAHIMVFTLISPKVKKRFPTYEHLVEAGVLNDNEKNIIKKMDEICPKQPKYWMPIVWASSIFTRARKEGRIRDDFALRTLNDSINQFRHNCILLLHYDTISIPLVYTQVVTLAVYFYFCASVIGNQWIDMSNKHGKEKLDYIASTDFYFPLFSTLEFFFFMGWLKVAETLICPFGEDDDDFEVNATIDRNIQVSYIIVDEMHNRHPQLIKDQYWDEVYPIELPGGGSEPPAHSTAQIQKMTTPRPSEMRFTEDEMENMRTGRTKLIWKRTQGSGQTDTIFIDRPSSDSGITNNEQLVTRHQHSIVSERTSMIISPPDFEEEEQEEEQEDEGITFERLREEREREKIERQQQKVQRTVENVAEVTADLPIRIPKQSFPSSTAPEEQSQKTDEDENTVNRDDQTKKTDEQNQNRKPDTP